MKNMLRLHLLALIMLVTLPSIAQISIENNTTCDYNVTLVEFDEELVETSSSSIELAQGQAFSSASTAAAMVIEVSEVSPDILHPAPEVGDWRFSSTTPCCRPANDNTPTQINDYGSCAATIKYNGNGTFSIN